MNAGYFRGKGNEQSYATYGINNGKKFTYICGWRKISIPNCGHCHGAEIKTI